MKPHYILILVACIYFSIANADGDMQFVLPNHSPEEVLAKVEEIVKGRNISLSNYTLESITYDYIKIRWSCYFEGEDLVLGNHFMVLLNDMDLNDFEIVRGL